MHTRLMHARLSLVALAFVCGTPAAAQDLPPRKAGLWEIKMTTEGHGMPPSTSEHCIDAETDKLMNSMGDNMRQDMCSKRDMKKVGNTIIMDSVCKFGAMTITSQSVASGDFNSAYSVKVTTQREGGPAIPGMPADGKSSMSIEAKWMGACKADQKPGDMIMAGRKFNIRDMQKNMPVPGAPPAQKK